MSTLDFVLSLAGVPQEQIEALDRNLPALARLCRTAKKLQPLLIKAQPLLAELNPIAAQAWDIIEPEMDDIKAVLPTVQEFIEFVNSKEKQQ